jgi:hypothetical protein
MWFQYIHPAANLVFGDYIARFLTFFIETKAQSVNTVLQNFEEKFPQIDFGLSMQEI